MKSYSTEKIRNLALVGHSASGKTSVCEALLYKTGNLKRLGKIEDGNTVTDFDKEEISRGVSISTAIAPVEWRDFKINLIDTPGYFDFSGEVYSSLRASEAALVVLDAQNGIEVGAEKVLKYTESIELPRIIFVNKMDKENVNFAKVVSDLHITFGKKVIPFTLALGEGENFKGIIDVLNKKAYEYDGFERKEVEIPEIRIEEVNHVYDTIVEVVAETDDELMEKFFDGEEFSHEEFMKGVTSALLNGSAVPLICGSATTGAGIDMLLDVITDYMPAPNDERAKRGFRNEDDNVRKICVDEPFSAVIFKTIVDPFVGRISIFKVMSGKITKDTEIFNSTKDELDKAAGLFFLRGKTQIETSEIVAGDIGAVSKLNLTETGDTICDKQNKTLYKNIKYPKPNLYFAIEPKSKNDEDKISQALHKLHEEDPSFVSERNIETKQHLIGGQGNVQLQIVLDKLKNVYGVETNIIPLRIAYRETIKGKSDVQGKHKKQSGGAGQYGDVFMRFEPSTEEFEFTEEVFGGAVPRNYFPAVEKGIRDSLEKGILAGYRVVNVKATLYDGSYHPVDSNEMAFKIAASLAFKKGMEQAHPVLLEPIMKVEVRIPESYMGDVMGDLNKRRGKVLGMEMLEDGTQLVIGEAPHSELFEYAIDLRSMTQARGDFTMEFDRYEEVPVNIAEKIIEESKAEK
ncbi:MULTISPECIES: elongation factor G [unclassified Parvimonas]|uniref:elongation factor G n=1 Tax=unclassified Parvimonas TaxID=1151464 RepID=UPI002B4A4371|nr:MULTISPECIES: elongation factor G [unclassified Parvimonas]MEB3024941.1 elongation factor G [Parvimonas sp. M13]MEB3089294.1 elongation factor G [Parvimonas sp. M20]